MPKFKDLIDGQDDDVDSWLIALASSPRTARIILAVVVILPVVMFVLGRCSVS